MKWLIDQKKENHENTKARRKTFKENISCLGIFVVFLSLSAPGQPSHFAFEKEGRFIAPEQRFSRSSIHSPDYEGPQPFDLLHYNLDITLAMTTDALHGKSTMTMRLKENVDSLVLHAVGLSLDTVKIDNVLKATRLDSLSESFTIYLNGTRNAGDTLRIAIAYHRLENFRRPSSRQGYYFFRDTIGLPANLGYTFSEPSDARFWFPCYDEPWEKATCALNITVPSGYVAASNGKLVGITNNLDGTATWAWQQNQPIAAYLVCMTVSRFSVSTLFYTKSTGDTIPLQYYTWNASPFIDSATTAAFLPTVREMVRAYSGFFGEYPFDKYGMTSIVPFGYLGMEHQTLTTMNRYYATSHRVVSHELAHQWWGDNVTCGTWADIWLNESFATYSEALWREHLYGFDSLNAYMRDTLSGFQFGSWQGAIYDPLGQGFNLFDQVVYTKGGWVLHTLRGVVGDSTFFKILRTYRNTYQGRSAVTAELKAVVDSVAGSDMSWFFNQWIYGRGWPKYARAYKWTGDSLTLVVYQLQPESNPTYKMPVQVRVYAGLASTTFTIWDSLRIQSFRIHSPLKPDSVKLDPEYWILKQLVPLPPDADSIVFSKSFKLWQNFPNPFNPTTNIVFSLPIEGRVILRLYDILGREVKTLIDGHQTAGPHVLTIEGRDLSSGVYYYRLQAGAFVETKKMILLR